MKYEIAQVQIVKFCNVKNQEKYYNGIPVMSYEREPVFFKRTCLVDNINNKAYNMYTLEEEFPLLQKDENGFLLPTQDIEIGVRYAIKEKTIKKDFQMMPEYLYRKHLLKKVLKRKN